MVIDGGSENKDTVAELAERYGVKRVVVSAYHPQTNGMIERGHKPIVDALSKISTGGSTNWVRNLPAVYRQIGQLCAHQPALLHITSIVGANPFFLLS